MKEKYERYQKFLLALFRGKKENWPVDDEVVEKIEDQLGLLTSKEGEVIRLRFGLKNDVRSTRKAIMEHLHISLYMVKEMEARALRKLRHPNRGRKLKVYFRPTLEERLEGLVEKSTDLRTSIARHTAEYEAGIAWYEKEFAKLIEEVRTILNKFE